MKTLYIRRLIYLKQMAFVKEDAILSVRHGT